MSEIITAADAPINRTERPVISRTTNRHAPTRLTLNSDAPQSVEICGYQVSGCDRPCLPLPSRRCAEVCAEFIVAQGGGPTAVINQSLAGVVLEARRHQGIQRVYGARHGVRGILNEDDVLKGHRGLLPCYE